MVELYIHLPEAGSSQIYLMSLLRRILESAVSDFDLRYYADYIKYRNIQDIKEHQRDNRRQRDKESRSVYAGPIKAFYESICTQDQVTLLEKLRMQASKLPKELLKDFLMPFLAELIIVADISSSEV